ncbi:hypothetical protein RRG08_008760 [Elysia crispata]|uniref:Uncharacterized protein n=1 Tax=Elysia crispata TaxID=231223 RepID=A0AAE0XW34_9GAST|nr:hypothetical protein RRG08_008760 [Elysia crispata]
MLKVPIHVYNESMGRPEIKQVIFVFHRQQKHNALHCLEEKSSVRDLCLVVLGVLTSHFHTQFGCDVDMRCSFLLLIRLSVWRGVGFKATGWMRVRLQIVHVFFTSSS